MLWSRITRALRAAARRTDRLSPSERREIEAMRAEVKIDRAVEQAWKM